MKDYPLILSVPMTDNSVLWEDMRVHINEAVFDIFWSLDDMYGFEPECDKEKYASLYCLFETCNGSVLYKDITIFDTCMYDQSYPQYIALIGFDNIQQLDDYLHAQFLTDMMAHPLAKIIVHRTGVSPSVPSEVLFPQKEK